LKSQKYLGFKILSSWFLSLLLGEAHPKSFPKGRTLKSQKYLEFKIYQVGLASSLWEEVGDGLFLVTSSCSSWHRPLRRNTCTEE
jgi:hypothetical protein